jgi:hypothetical protein
VPVAGAKKSGALKRQLTTETEMTQDELKQAVAEAAIDYVVPGAIIGVGTGSTANFFIDELGRIKDRIPARSPVRKPPPSASAGHGIRCSTSTTSRHVPVYVDGADEITRGMAMIKGGGGALTREKIVAAVAHLRLHRRRFQAGADDGPVSPAGGSHPDGPRLRRARAGQARRRAGAARRLHHRQRQYHPRRQGALHHRPEGLETRINAITASSPTASSRGDRRTSSCSADPTAWPSIAGPAPGCHESVTQRAYHLAPLRSRTLTAPESAP